MMLSASKGIKSTVVHGLNYHMYYDMQIMFFLLVFRF